MDNILHVVYGYVYDVSVSNFEQLSLITHELKSSNFYPNIIPYVTVNTFVLYPTTEE